MKTKILAILTVALLVFGMIPTIASTAAEGENSTGAYTKVSLTNAQAYAYASETGNTLYTLVDGTYEKVTVAYPVTAYYKESSGTWYAEAENIVNSVTITNPSTSTQTTVSLGGRGIVVATFTVARTGNWTSYKYYWQDANGNNVLGNTYSLLNVSSMHSAMSSYISSNYSGYANLSNTSYTDYDACYYVVYISLTTVSKAYTYSYGTDNLEYSQYDDTTAPIDLYVYHTHDYSSEVTTEPTCTDTGVKTYTCTWTETVGDTKYSCDASYTEVVAKNGHSWSSSTSSDGTTTYTCGNANSGVACSECITVTATATGKTYDGKSIEAGSYTVSINETEIADGSLSQYGTISEAYYQSGSGDAMSGLPTNAGTYTYAATFTPADGVDLPTVKASKSITIDQATSAIAYNVTSVSKTEGDDAFTNELTKTTVYGNITYTVTDADGANTELATIAEDGCVTISGKGEGTVKVTATIDETSDYTGATATYEIIISHNTVTDEAKEPTCTETGLTEGSHCSVCEEVLVEQEEIAATGHAYTCELTKTPTVTEEGTYTYTCANCNGEYTEPIAAITLEVTDETEDADAKTSNEETAEALVYDELGTVIEAILAGEETTAVSEETGEKLVEAVLASETIVTEIIAEIGEASDEDQALATTILSDGESIGLYIDIKILLYSKDAEGGLTYIGTLDELTQTLTFTIDIPTELQNQGYEFYIIRVHGDSIENIGGAVSEDGTQITFSTDLFSTYALAYYKAETEAETEPETKTETTNVDATETSDNNQLAFYSVMMLLGLISIGGVAQARRKRN